jgi:hypothetical protein
MIRQAHWIFSPTWTPPSSKMLLAMPMSCAKSPQQLMKAGIHRCNSSLLLAVIILDRGTLHIRHPLRANIIE